MDEHGPSKDCWNIGLAAIEGKREVFAKSRVETCSVGGIAARGGCRFGADGFGASLG